MSDARVKVVWIFVLATCVLGSALAAQTVYPPQSPPRPGGNRTSFTWHPGQQWCEIWSEDSVGWRHNINLPYLVFLGDVVLIQNYNVDLTRDLLPSDPNWANARNNCANWSDVLHIDNTPMGTFFSDLERPNPNTPWEINLCQYPLAQPAVYLYEDSSGLTFYFPIPGAPIVFWLFSDPPTNEEAD